MAGTDGEIDLGVVGVDEGLTGLIRQIGSETLTNLDAVLAKVNSAVGGFKRLRDEVTSGVVEMQRLANEAKKIQPNATEQALGTAKAQTAGEFAGRPRITTQPLLSDGRSISDIRATEQVVQGVLTGIKTTDAQIAARVKQAGVDAAKRLITTTADAIQAQLNQSSVSTQIKVLNYSTADGANFRVLNAQISDRRLRERLGGASSLAEYDQVVAARIEQQRKENLRRAADRQRERARARLAAYNTRLANDPTFVVAEAAKAGLQRQNADLAARINAADSEQEKIDILIAEKERQANARAAARTKQRAEQRARARLDAYNDRLANDPTFVVAEAAKAGRQHQNADLAARINAADSEQEKVDILIAEKERQANARAAARSKQRAAQRVDAYNNRLANDPTFVVAEAAKAGRQRQNTGLAARINAAESEQEKVDILIAEKQRQANARAAARSRQRAEQRVVAEERRLQEDDDYYVAAQRRRASRANLGIDATTLRRLPSDEERTAYINQQDRQRQLAQRSDTYQQYHALRLQENIQTSLIGVVGAGFGIAGIAKAVHGVVELDDAITRFAAITGTSSRNTEEFKNNLLTLASTSRFTAQELTAVATTLGQAGLSAKEIQQTLPAVIALATSTGSQLTQAVEVLTAVLGAYNFTTSRTGDLANIMSAALTKTRLTIEQLSYGLQYSADVAAQTGVSITELTAVFGGLAQAGIRSGSVMGTAARQIINELANPTAKLQKEFDRLGITMADVDIRANGLMGVFDNLKARGFGTAEAIRGLETRTVTTFAALQAQGNTIKRLNEEFLLATAASDGAKKANESLIAVVTMLGNSVLNLTDRVFAPFLNVLKAATSGVASLFQAATALGPTLPSLGTGIAAVAVGLAGWKITQIIGHLLELRTATLGAAAAQRVLALASGNVTTAFAGLTLGPAGWVGLALGTAVAATAAYISWSSSVETAADKIDRLKTNLQDLDSRVQQGATHEHELNKTITELLEKREKLNNDALARRGEIIKAQRDFEGLGSSIRANATSIDELITALRNLKAELAKKTPTLIEQQIIDNNKLIEEKRKEAREKIPKSYATIADKTGIRAVDYGPDGNPYFVDLRSETIDESRRLLGPEFGDLARRLGDPKSYSDKDSFAASADDVSRIRQKQDELTEKRKPLEDIPSRSLSEEAELTKINGGIKLLDALSDVLKTNRALHTELQADRGAGDRYRVNLAEANIKAAPQYQGLSTEISDSSAVVRSALTATTQDKGLNHEERAQQFTDLKKKAQAAADNITARIKDEIARYTQEGLNPDGVAGAFQPLLDQAASMVSLVNGSLDKIKDTLNTYIRPVWEREKRREETAIRTALAKLKNSTSQSDVDATSEFINASIDRLKSYELKLARLSLPNPFDAGDEASKLKLEAVADEVEERRQQYAEQLIGQRRQMAEAIFQTQDRYLSALKKNVDTQIAGLEKELKSPVTTETRAKELRAKINELFDQAKQIVDEQLNAKYQRDLLTTPHGSFNFNPATAGTGTVQRQIIDAANTQGQSALIPFLLRTAEVESGMNPRVNEKGLFQFLESTWKDYNPNPDRRLNVDDQVTAAISKITRDRSMFKKAFDRDPTEQESYALWQQQGAVIPLMKNPDAPAIDILRQVLKSPALAQTALRSGQGTENMTAREFLQSIFKQYGSSEGVRKYTLPSEDVARQERDNALAANKQDFENRSEGLRRQEAYDNFKDTKANLSIQDRSLNRRIAAQRALAGLNDTSLDTAYNASNEAARLSLLQIANTKRLVEADPSNADKANAEKVDAAEAAMAGATARFVEMVLSAGRELATKGLVEDKTELARLRKMMTEFEKPESKATPEEQQATRQRYKQVSDRVDRDDAIVGKRKELLFITEQIAALQKEAGADQEQTNRLVTRQTELTKELMTQEEARNQIMNMRNRPESLGGALNNGSMHFFRSQGMLGEDGKFLPMTAQISQAWSTMLSGMESASTTFFVNWSSGTMRIGKAFREFGVSVLQTMQQIVAKALSQQILRSLFGGMFESGASGGILDNLASSGPVLAPFAQGGYVRAVNGLYNQNRDSVRAILQPGEFVMRKSAVNMIGRDTLEGLNSQGNRLVSQAPIKPQSAEPAVAQKPLNVWVVSPDQTPPPGPNDIVHHVASNIASGGQIKQLIKQVNAGIV